MEFSKWEQDIHRKPEAMKQFLKSYQYSSYQDSIRIDRAEKGIIQPQAFPGYFSSGKDFEDFIANYFAIDEVGWFPSIFGKESQAKETTN